MSPHLVLLLVSTLTGVAAVMALTGAGRRDRRGERPPTRPDAGGVVRGVVAAGITALVLTASGWLLPSIIIGGATWFGLRTWHRREARSDDIERTDALASWIENLRDVLIAGDQPVGAISATVATCPAAIRGHVRRLAAGLGRQEPDVVLRRFADDLDDPLGDLVAAGLLIAVQRGARTVAVLSALAEQARHQADRRRLVEAERAPVQREVALLTVTMAALIVGVLVFGRAEYLRPYGSSGGQLFLGSVLLLYAALLVRVQRLAAYPRPRRFLTAGADTARARLGGVAR